MNYSIEDLPHATGYERSAHETGRGLTLHSRYATEDLFADGLWLPIEGIWAGDSYGCSPSEVIMHETNEAAALAISDAAGVEYREYHAGYWWLQVMTADGEVIDCAREVIDEVALALANYPLLAEDAFCEREWEETSENIEEAVKDELRDAPAGMWNEWDEACDAAGVDLVDAIIGHPDLEFESEDCWPRFYNCSVLKIAADVVAAL